MTYTPGPWQAFSYAINKNLITICAGGSVICNVVDGHSGNARLIAAAPDLLEACTQAIALLTPPGCTCGAHETIIPILTAAIAKATGEQ